MTELDNAYFFTKDAIVILKIYLFLLIFCLSTRIYDQMSYNLKVCSGSVVSGLLKLRFDPFTIKADSTVHYF